MRRIASLEDAQLVINDLLNFKSRVETGAQNLKGNRVMNIGAGKADSDAATVKQLNDAISSVQIPDSTSLINHRTIIWSNQFTPAVGDTFPPYCVVTKELVGTPIAVWIAASVASSKGSAKLKINFRYNSNKDDLLLIEDLDLNPEVSGPVNTSAFVSPIPKLGIGCFIYPVINKASDASGITIGLVVQRQQTVKIV